MKRHGRLESRRDDEKMPLILPELDVEESDVALAPHNVSVHYASRWCIATYLLLLMTTGSTIA